MIEKGRSFVQCALLTVLVVGASATGLTTTNDGKTDPCSTDELNKSLDRCFVEIYCAQDARKYSDYCTVPARRPLSQTERAVLLLDRCAVAGNPTLCQDIKAWLESNNVIELVMDHATGRWTVQPGELTIPWEDDVNGVPTFYLPSDAEVIVSVGGSNPLLYSASFGEVTEEDPADQGNLTKLVGVLGNGIGTAVDTLAKPQLESVASGIDAAKALQGVTEDELFNLLTGDLETFASVKEKLMGGADTDKKKVLEEKIQAERKNLDLYLVWYSAGTKDVDSLLSDIKDLQAKLKTVTDEAKQLNAARRAASGIVRASLANPSSTLTCSAVEPAGPSHYAKIDAELTALERARIPPNVPCTPVFQSYASLLDAHINPSDLSPVLKLTHDFEMALEAAQRSDPESVCDPLNQYVDTLEYWVKKLQTAAANNDDSAYMSLLEAQRTHFLGPAENLVNAAGALAKAKAAHSAAIEAGPTTLKAASTLDRFVQRCFTHTVNGSLVGRIMPRHGDPSANYANRSVKPKWNKRRVFPVVVTMDSAYKDDVNSPLPPTRTSSFKVIPRWRRYTAFTIGLTWSDVVNPTWEATACPSNGSIEACQDTGQEEPQYIKRTKEESQTGKLGVFGTWFLFESFAKQKDSYAKDIPFARYGLELGLALDTTNPAYFVGGAVHIGKWLKLSGGHTGQLVNVLNGQSENQLLPPGGAVTTKHGMDHGTYVSLSVTLDSLSLFSAD